METKLILPRINAAKFSRAFVLAKARRTVTAAINKIGPENIRFLVANDKDLPQYVPREMQEQYLLVAKNYPGLGEIISDEDFVAMIPPWAIQIVQSYGDTGVQWLRRQLVWLRSFITL